MERSKTQANVDKQKKLFDVHQRLNIMLKFLQYFDLVRKIMTGPPNTSRHWIGCDISGNAFQKQRRKF